MCAPGQVSIALPGETVEPNATHLDVPRVDPSELELPLQPLKILVSLLELLLPLPPVLYRVRLCECLPARLELVARLLAPPPRLLVFKVTQHLVPVALLYTAVLLLLALALSLALRVRRLRRKRGRVCSSRHSDRWRLRAR